MVTALLLVSASAVFAAQDKKEARSIPYLGPGADKLSPEEYEKIYKNYIQTSVLLGYPFSKEKAAPCDQALSSLFRSAGMFGYPVPVDAQQVQRSVKTSAGRKVETYEMAGLIVQVAREAKSQHGAAKTQFDAARHHMEHVRPRRGGDEEDGDDEEPPGVKGHAVYPAFLTISAQAASSITSMPSAAACLSFEPAPGPATTRPVLAETDPAARAPRASAWALASSRLMVSSLPVKTTIFPATALALVSTM